MTYQNIITPKLNYIVHNKQAHIYLPKQKTTYILLLIILTTIGIIRYGLIDLPLERDEGEYAYAGQLILQGIPPYTEVYNMKFPGIYAAYAFILAIFGESYQGIHIGLLVINLMTIVLVFLLAQQILDKQCAIVSAAVFALLSLNQSLDGVVANAEHFVILFVVAGLLLMLKGLNKLSLSSLFFAGLLLGLGGVMKQHGIAFILLAGLYILFYSNNTIKETSLKLQFIFQSLISLTAGIIAIFSLLFLIMFWLGVLKPFWFWTFEYASEYVTQIPMNKAFAMFSSNFTFILRSAPLIWLLVGVGFLIFILKNLSKNKKKFLFIYTIFSLLSICPGFYFRSHYFILLLPCAALFAGGAIKIFSELFGKFFPEKIGYSISLSLIILILLISIYNQRNFLFKMEAFESARSTWGLNPFYESLKIADFIKRNTTPEDRIAILGSEPQILFYSKRKSASGYIYMYPLMENQKFALKMQKEFIKDVETTKPKIVIYVGVPTSWVKDENSHQEIFEWFEYYFKNSNLRLIGIVKLFENKTLYKWHTNLEWPANSPCWVAIFQRS